MLQWRHGGDAASGRRTCYKGTSRLLPRFISFATMARRCCYKRPRALLQSHIRAATMACRRCCQRSPDLLQRYIDAATMDRRRCCRPAMLLVTLCRAIRRRPWLMEERRRRAQMGMRQRGGMLNERRARCTGNATTVSPAKPRWGSPATPRLASPATPRLASPATPRRVDNQGRCCICGYGSLRRG